MKKNSLSGIITVGILLFGVVFVGLNKAYAHCDTLAGPVVKDAKVALEKGDVTSVLKWVKKGDEQEIRAAFNIALTERKKSAEAKEKADMKFFETVVKLHRATEGEPFTGLKSASSIEPIIVSSDNALETGSVENLSKDMSNDLIKGIKERFDRALEKKKHKDESVEAGREYVEAYVEYTHYVESVGAVIAGKGGHHHEEFEETKLEGQNAK